MSRSARLAPIALGLLAACAGGQLAELEEEHDELRAEYDDLRENVEALKNEMVELGLITEAQANARAKVSQPSKGGKAKAGGRGRRVPGNPRPETELSEQLAWTAERTGSIPELPELGPAERGAGDCGWTFTVEELQPISDFPLNRDGFGKSGPVQLIEDGQPMTAHAMPAEFEDACSGAFRHAGFLFLFSPTGTVDDGGKRTYEIRLDPAFPLIRGDDERPMYWVYPGTTATFGFERGWDEAWGEPRLTVGGVVVGEGAAGLEAPGLEADLTEEGRFGESSVLELDDGGFTVVVESPVGGPYVLIDTLTLGNPEHAVVVTAEAAWAAREKG